MSESTKGAGGTERPWWPGDETGWERYHEQMFDLAAAPNGFVRWKIQSTGVNIARQLAGARNRGAAAWRTEHGDDPDRWPLAHPPAVVWMPYAASAACLRCLWIDHTVSRPDQAAAAARRHSLKYLPEGSEAVRLLLDPLRVWARHAPGDGPAPAIAD